MFRAFRTRTPLLFLALGMLAVLFVPGRSVVAATGPALSVDAGSDQHPISPLIYGINSYGTNFTNADLAQDLRLPLRRWGGNTTTRYNWQNDMANHASDFFFENLPEDNPDPSHLPDGSAVDRLIDQDRSTNIQTLLTVPLIGWVPKARKDDHPYDCGFPRASFPTQKSFDQFDDCGDGLNPDGTPITGNLPSQTSIAVGPAFVQDWMRHLIGRYGTADEGGVKFYALDNEPGLWHETHRDVHPVHPTYQELRDLGIQYAAAIKDVDPDALTLGPVQDGWSRYFYASYTDDPDPVATQDRTNHGEVPFVEWYLQQMAAAETPGHRLLDYFDLHYYPAAVNDLGTVDDNDDEAVSLAPAGNADTQALRLRSTRSLWDPTYVDESWIPSTDEATPVNGAGVDGAIQLIPRMRDWVNKNYPGTKLAISEYNWGALDDMNGALAQADVLGIFGREGLDLATLWEPPATTDPGAYAFRMFRNYDGAGSAFGDTSVRASSADQVQLAIYAARRNGALTLMVINKSTSSLTSQVNLSGFTPLGTAHMYRYSAANLGAIVKQADQPVTAGGFSATFPASSITLFELPPANVSLTPRVRVPLVAR